MHYHHPEGSQSELLQFLAEQGEPPAFVRRTIAMEEATERVYNQCRLQQQELLTLPKMQLAMLRDTAPTWAPLRQHLSAPCLEQLQQLETDWQPPRIQAQGFVFWRPSPRILIERLQLSIRRFNRAWQSYITDIDLNEINRIRTDYNRYFPIEKACAFRSETIGWAGFEPIELITPKALLQRFPLIAWPDQQNPDRSTA